jgi:hypothetical protein
MSHVTPDDRSAENDFGLSVNGSGRHSIGVGVCAMHSYSLLEGACCFSLRMMCMTIVLCHRISRVNLFLYILSK